MDILIIDYGMGNIASIKNAFDFLGVKCKLSNSSNDIMQAKKILLPGVGSFHKAMELIQGQEIDKFLHDAIANDSHILGICLGMQLLFESSTEDKFSSGLGFFESPVDKFTEQDIKIPHVGFDNVNYQNNSILFDGLEQNLDFYFTHSYRVFEQSANAIHSFCDYGEGFVSSIEKGNVFGTQFHPEKSHINGLNLLKNFIKY